MADFTVILPAAGRSSRFGDPKQKKVFAELDGRAVWLRAVEPFVNRDDVAQVIVAIAPEDRELFERRYRASVAFMNIKVIDGGAERHDTIAKALECVDASCSFIAVHDAARPCVSRELIDSVFAAAREFGAALPGLPISDTLKRVDSSNTIVSTVPRFDLRGANSSSVSPRLARSRLWRSRPAFARRDDHRRRSACRSAGPLLQGRPRLAVQPQDHDERRSPSRARDPSIPSRAEARRSFPPVRRRETGVGGFAESEVEGLVFVRRES